MIVVVSDEAEADLERIADHIAKDNPARALTFIMELRESCENLAVMATAFPLVPRYEHADIRRRIYGSYLIFYRVGQSDLQSDIQDNLKIEILRILHGAMNYEPLLFPEAGAN